jgi:hypothetical protein
VLACNSMDGSFCVRRWRRHWLASASRPSSTPTRAASSFTDTLIAAGIRISMDGRGRWIDNVFIERMWHELKGYADRREAHAGIACVDCLLKSPAPASEPLAWSHRWGHLSKTSLPEPRGQKRTSFSSLRCIRCVGTGLRLTV